ncbi:hypothetical protein [Pseudomonas serbica]|uniref:hypothetical protein n=1 Tax=Pseudomonas serbica TaxID=2965074 RepID=UPI00237B64C0|nr:hypothetical protein [Pseudomonas serbica]
MSQINLNVTDYGREAYELASEWYHGNGPVPIPNLTESQYADQGLKDYSVLFQERAENGKNNQSIRFSSKSTLKYISIQMTPIIAAIQHGFSDSKILDLMLHHKVEPDHFRSMTCDETEPLFKAHSGKDFNLQDLYNSLIKALNSKPKGRSLLNNAYESNNYNEEMTIAFLQSDDSSYWNSTRLQKVANIIAENGGYTVPHYTAFNEFIEQVSSTSCFPENSALEFLRRSGMFNEDLIRKRSASYGMWETTLKRLLIDRPMALQLFLACGNATDRNDQAVIRRALKSISIDSYDSTINPAYAIQRLKDVLVDCAIDDIFNSDVFKLNLMSLDRTEDFLGMSAEDGDAAAYKLICNQNSELISRLAKEVLNVPLHQMGYSHFSCWRRLPLLTLMPQRLRPGTAESLVTHMLRAFDQFTYPDNGTEEKIEVDRNARAGLKDLVQVLACHHDFDYSYFHDLSSPHKKDLIMMGLDVKKLPGLTLQDLGDVFSHDMGL